MKKGFLIFLISIGFLSANAQTEVPVKQKSDFKIAR